MGIDGMKPLPPPQNKPAVTSSGDPIVIIKPPTAPGTSVTGATTHVGPPPVVDTLNSSAAPPPANREVLQGQVNGVPVSYGLNPAKPPIPSPQVLLAARRLADLAEQLKKGNDEKMDNIDQHIKDILADSAKKGEEAQREAVAKFQELLAKEKEAQKPADPKPPGAPAKSPEEMMKAAQQAAMDAKNKAMTEVIGHAAALQAEANSHINTGIQQFINQGLGKPPARFGGNPPKPTAKPVTPTPAATPAAAAAPAEQSNSSATPEGQSDAGAAHAAQAAAQHVDAPPPPPVTPSFSGIPQMPKIDIPNPPKWLSSPSLPNLPSVPVPTGDGSKVDVMKKLLENNPWFNGPSFIAAINAAVADYLSTLMATQWMEGSQAIETNKFTYELKMDSAELTKKSADIQADKEQIEVNKEIMQAAMAGVQVAYGMGIMARVNRDPQVASATHHSKTLQENYDAKYMKNENGKLVDKPGPDGYVGDTPGAPTKAQKDWKADKANDMDNLQKAILAKEQATSAVFNHHQNMFQTKMTIIEKSMSASFGAVGVALTRQKGTIDAQKEVLQANISNAEIKMQNNRQSRDDQKSAFDEAIRALKAIIDSIYRAHYLGSA